MCIAAISKRLTEYRRLLAWAAVLAVVPDGAAHAHTVGSGDSTWDSVVVLGLALSGTLYGTGIARLWRRAGTGRGVRTWQAAIFAAAWATVAIALVSPLEAVSDELFAAHMVEHELLMVVAAPLFVFARPIGVMLWGLPIAWRRTLGRAAQAVWFARAWNAVLRPGWAFSVHAAALWLWHAPALFQAALADPGVHALQHLSFFGAALLYWWSLTRPSARRHRGLAVLSLLATSVHSGFLGALLALSGNLWYPAYGHDAVRFGLTALEDQQLAGIIMWVPGGLTYMGAALIVLYKLMSADSRPPLGDAHPLRA